MSGAREKEARRFEKLLIRAQELGYHYRGDSVRELESIIADEGAEREGMPPCYARSYDPHSEDCRQCDAFKRCGDKTAHRTWALQEPPPIEPCPLCDGDLVIELYDGDGNTVGRACSTPGCRGNTVDGN